jgi:AcrR family transcriptional regulator
VATQRVDGQRRREQLLDAALECFTTQGLLQTGIEDVRRAAGASPSSVYHLFDGMPGLVAELLKRTFERLLSHLDTRLSEATTAEEAIVSLVRAHLEWVSAHRDQARFMYQAMALELAGDAQEEVLAAKDVAKGPVFAHLQRFIRAGDLPDWDFAVLECVVLGPTHEACRRFLVGHGPDPSSIWNLLPGLAWRAVTPHEPVPHRRR